MWLIKHFVIPRSKFKIYTGSILIENDACSFQAGTVADPDEIPLDDEEDIDAQVENDDEAEAAATAVILPEHVNDPNEICLSESDFV